MPRSQGTSRKGKPGRLDRLSGMGKSLQKKQSQQNHAAAFYKNGKAQSQNGGGGGGMQMQQQRPGAVQSSIGVSTDSSATKAKRQSVLEMPDLDDFLARAQLAEREFASEREGLVVLDTTASTAYNRGPSASVTWQDQQSQQPQQKEQPFEFKELSVPRRPAWDAAMSREELDRRERRSFLEWRRGIAAAEAQLVKRQQQQQSQQLQSQSQQTHSHSAVTTVTPFEKNLEVWRQLWRVVERSDCVLQLVDARNPLFYLSRDLRDYCVHEFDNHKPMMVLVNKSDYLTRAQRRQWRAHLHQQGWSTVLFFSAVREQDKLDRAAAEERRQLQEMEEQRVRAAVGNDNDIDEHGDDGSEAEEDHEEGGDDDDEDDQKSKNNNNKGAEENEDEQNSKSDTNLEHNEQQQKQNQKSDVNDNNNNNKNEEDDDDDATGVNQLLTRQQLLDAMLAFARRHRCQPDPRYGGRIQFGFIGFPNVGKSSVINVLVGSSKHAHGLARVAVARQPGKTKHFQTLLVRDAPQVMLCDCPGLVFPSLVSHTADLVAAGVYPIAQMQRDQYWPVVELICRRIPRTILNAQYGIHLPVPTAQELREEQRGHASDTTSSNGGSIPPPPPTAEELLTTFCAARRFTAAGGSGLPDFPRAARRIVQDYAAGRLLYCHAPPDCGDGVPAFHEETVATALAQTQKLRDKLQLQQQQQQNDPKAASNDDEDHHRNLEKEKEDYGNGKNDNADDEDDRDLVDADLLELIGESAPSSSSTAGHGNHPHSTNNGSNKHGKKGRTPKQKWGKKDRKNRNRDPYGCHSTPDAALYGDSSRGNSSNNSGSGGVVVNAGRYSQHGYTRPASYPVAR